MTVLVAMSPGAFVRYADAAVLAFAQDNVASGRWPEAGAIARSRADFGDLLPQGPETPDNYLFEIRAADPGPAVGVLWFAVEEKHGPRSGFVYDVEIWEEFRRNGHATAAFEALESYARTLGVSRIGLHVFGHNQAAQALYRKLGYGVTGLNMQKGLDVEEPPQNTS